MTDLEAAGLHECDTCGRVYESEIALIFCCRDDTDQTPYQRHWERD